MFWSVDLVIRGETRCRIRCKIIVLRVCTIVDLGSERAKSSSAGKVYLKSFMLNLKGERSLVFVYSRLSLVHVTLAGGRRFDGPGTVVRFPIGTIDVCLPQNIQIYCGPH